MRLPGYLIRVSRRSKMAARLWRLWTLALWLPRLWAVSLLWHQRLYMKLGGLMGDENTIQTFFFTELIRYRLLWVDLEILLTPFPVLCFHLDFCGRIFPAVSSSLWQAVQCYGKSPRTQGKRHTTLQLPHCRDSACSCLSFLKCKVHDRTKWPPKSYPSLQSVPCQITFLSRRASLYIFFLRALIQQQYSHLLSWIIVVLPWDVLLFCFSFRRGQK